MTKRIRTLQYKAEVDGKYIDNAIASWTWIVNLPMKFKHKIPLKVYNELCCSHSEVWLSDEDNKFYAQIEINEPIWFGEREYRLSYASRTASGLCYTSTMGQTGGENRTGSGMVCKPAGEVLKHPERWYAFEYEVSDEAFEAIKKRLDREVANNKGYDKSLIARYFLPQWAVDKLKIDKPNMWICSEITALIVYMITCSIVKNGDMIADGNNYMLYEYLRHDLNPSPFRLALYQYLAGKERIVL